MNRRKFFTSLATIAAALSVAPLAIAKHKETKVGKLYKLKARWTPELAEDLSAYHGISAEKELEALLAYEINEEVTRKFPNKTVVEVIKAPYVVDPITFARHQSIYVRLV